MGLQADRMVEALTRRGTAIAARGISLVLNLCLAVVIARLVGPAASGAFFLAYATANLAGMIGRSGTDVWAMKTLPPMFHAGRTQEFANELKSLRRQSWLGSGVAGMALLLFAVALLVIDRDNMFAWSLLFVAPSVPIVSAAILNSSALRASNKISLGAFAEVGMSQGIVIVGLLAVSRLTDVPETLPAVLYALATAITLAASHRWTSSALPPDAWSEARASPIERPQQRAMLHMMTSGVLFFLMTSMPLFILGLASTSDEVGIYNAATRAATVLAIIPALQVTYLIPRVSRTMGEGDTHQTNVYLRRAVRQASVVMSVALVVILVGADTIMGIFGEDFSSGKTVLVILALGQALVIALGNVNPIMSLVGLERASARIMAVLVAVTAIPMAIASSQLGAGGVAATYVIAMVIYSVTCNILLRKRVGISCQLG